MKRPLKNITAEALAPAWSNRRISADRIGAALGCTGSAVRQKARSLGLDPRGYAKDACKYGNDEMFRRMWLAGVNVHDMRAYFGFAQVQAVNTRRVALGLPPRVRVKGSGGHGGWPSVPIRRFFADDLGIDLEAELGEAMRREAEGGVQR